MQLTESLQTSPVKYAHASNPTQQVPSQACAQLMSPATPLSHVTESPGHSVTSRLLWGVYGLRDKTPISTAASCDVDTTISESYDLISCGKDIKGAASAGAASAS